MSLPFSLEQFLQTFRDYHTEIGLAPVALSLLGVALIALANARVASRHRLISVGLAALWLWSGFVYHLVFFSQINPTARLFAFVFIGQAVLFLFLGGFRESLVFAPQRTVAGFAGAALIAYALIIYPVLGWTQGHGYPSGPSFGAPCPTTIFTIGILLWTRGRIPLVVATIPAAWAVVGTSAAIQLGMREDLGLTVSGLLLLIELVRRRATRPHPAGRGRMEARVIG